MPSVKIYNGSSANAHNDDDDDGDENDDENDDDPQGKLKTMHSKPAPQAPQRSPKKQDDGLASGTFKLLLFLSSLPISLAFFVFFCLGPSLDPSPAFLAASSGAEDNSSMALHSGLGCPGFRKKYFMFPHRPWHASLQPKDFPRLGIMTTTASGLEQILPWLYYHRTLGVELFFLFTEGKASKEEALAVLQTIPGVKVLPRNDVLDELQSYKPGRNKTLLWSMAGKPCNYELFVRQALNGDTAIPLAQAEGVEWLIHIDTDELLYPAGTPDFSLQSLLGSMNRTTNHVVFSNYESAVEREDVEEPFLEVTLFKKSPGHVDKTLFDKYVKEAQHNNPNYMLTYGNGKAAARVVPGLRSNGAHRFNNPSKKYTEHTLKHAAVLHYSYTRFSDLTSRRKRCRCKPTKKSVKSCFFLEFDRQAYIVAATQTPDQMLQWYRNRVVWSDKEQVQRLLRAGVFARIYTPQVMLEGILSSGLIEATMKAGQEELQRRRKAKRQRRGAAHVNSHEAVEGAWGTLLHRAYGLVGSVQGRGFDPSVMRALARQLQKKTDIFKAFTTHTKQVLEGQAQESAQ